MDFVLFFCWQVYREAQDSTVGCAVYCSPFSSSPNLLDGVPLSTQYKALDSVDIKRLAARRQNTTYCYDFPLVCSALKCQIPIYPCQQIGEIAGSYCYLIEPTWNIEQAKISLISLLA